MSILAAGERMAMRQATKSASRGAAARVTAGGRQMRAAHAGGPTFGERWASRGFALESWDTLFSRWFPSNQKAGIVEAQGSKATPNKAVLHTALSIAFGLTGARTFSNIGLKVENNHTTNTVKVGFAVSSTAVLDLLAMETLFYAGLAKEASELDTRGLLSDITPWFSPTPWIVGRHFAEAPPVAPDGKGNGAQNVLEAMKKILDAINRLIGGQAVWKLHHDTVHGGEAPAIMIPALAANRKQAMNPFDRMTDEVQLTREPAGNPQPPAMNGIDSFRTLVAQVLHDPGVRPPRPRTDAGPPCVENELEGK